MTCLKRVKRFRASHRLRNSSRSRNAGHLLDYRLVWPSTLFAVEYFACDVLVGLMMVSVGLTLKGESGAKHARRMFTIGGTLCLLGTIGPLSGRMLLQNISVAGYAIMLPIAAVLIAGVFVKLLDSRGNLPS